jgi:hypothetical protein
MPDAYKRIAMKIIALSVPGPTPDPKKTDELAGEEARNAWELLKADVVREAYLRKDKPGSLSCWRHQLWKRRKRHYPNFPSIAMDLSAST